MADRTILLYDRKINSYIPVLYHENSDGSFSPTSYGASGDGLTDEELRATPVQVSLATGTNEIGKVQGVLVTADADLTQLVTVTTSGTPVQGPNKTNPGGWYMKSDPTNTGNIFIMFHGQTKATKGYPLSSGQIHFLPIANLNVIDLDASVNAQKAWFIKA